uniref:Uncharacterized protein n=1 Tax=Thermodesulfobium narugense TaxID=184064 RepID=A0A7C5P8U5_9BACT
MLKKYMLSSLTVEQNKNTFLEQDAQGTLVVLKNVKSKRHPEQDAQGTIKALRVSYIFTE